MMVGNMNLREGLVIIMVTLGSKVMPLCNNFLLMEQSVDSYPWNVTTGHRFVHRHLLSQLRLFRDCHERTSIFQENTANSTLCN